MAPFTISSQSPILCIIASVSPLLYIYSVSYTSIGRVLKVFAEAEMEAYLLLFTPMVFLKYIFLAGVGDYSSLRFIRRFDSFYENFDEI